MSSFSRPLGTDFSRPSGTDVPGTCEVPHFAPVRVRGGRCQLRRLVRCRRRALAAGLAVTAAALVAAGPGNAAAERGGGPAPGTRTVGDAAGEARPERERDRNRERNRERVRNREPAVEMVGAPVRIADGATVRLLKVGDRVDVIAAAAERSAGGGARVVARGARVTGVPEASERVG
ncbi:hypothetical protein, partial [Streptomyces apricus]|uniref:hypothetical protein n=1 Tax=Streptomyces apricus TaxID=1828112 RepID=UPI0038B50288